MHAHARAQFKIARVSNRGAKLRAMSIDFVAGWCGGKALDTVMWACSAS